MSDAEDKSPSPETAPMQGAAEPFRRGRITWGRPPQAVFHVGPLPRDEGLARLTAMPPYPKPAQARPAPSPRQPAPAAPTPPAGRAADVLGGSLVPRRRPAPTAPGQIAPAQPALAQTAPDLQPAAPQAPQAAPAPDTAALPLTPVAAAPAPAEAPTLPAPQAPIAGAPARPGLAPARAGRSTRAWRAPPS